MPEGRERPARGAGSCRRPGGERWLWGGWGGCAPSLRLPARPLRSPPSFSSLRPSGPHFKRRGRPAGYPWRAALPGRGTGAGPPTPGRDEWRLRGAPGRRRRGRSGSQSSLEGCEGGGYGQREKGGYGPLGEQKERVKMRNTVERVIGMGKRGRKKVEGKKKCNKTKEQGRREVAKEE